MIYLDTSALIKRFVDEKGSLLVRSLVQRERTVATAKIAYAKIFAGLTRKLREGNISKAQYALACRQFERDWRVYIRVELGDDILGLARDLIQRRSETSRQSPRAGACTSGATCNARTAKAGGVREKEEHRAIFRRNSPRS